MTTLADEILATFPALLEKHQPGPLAADVAAHLSADVASVRAAFKQLVASGRAKIVRRKRALHLVATDYPIPICIICRREFAPVAKRTKTCSHSCARHWAWQNEDMRERHRASVKASRTPELLSRLSQHFKKVRGTPEARQKLAEQNRKNWRDPVTRARRLVALEDAWRGEKAAARRAKASTKKLTLWADPEWKRKTCEAMRTGKRGRFKRAVLSLIADGCDAGDIAARVGLSLEQVKIIWRRAVRHGEVERAPPDGRKGRGSQSPEHIRKRVAAKQRSRLARAGSIKGECHA